MSSDSLGSAKLRHETTADVLPEGVLLEIFDYCQLNQDTDLMDLYSNYSAHGVWHTLVHVCRRWRQIIFASPRRLDLKLLCTHGVSVKKNLDCFPALPIIIEYGYDGDLLTPDDEDNLVAALERHDRVLSVKLIAISSQLEKVISVMSKGPFPVLTVLRLSLDGSRAQRRLVMPELVLRSGFLGGSAPCLQEITLNCVPFPMLPTLLVSSNDLVTLDLSNMPLAGYIVPETMVAYMASLPRLQSVCIEFSSPSSLPDQIRFYPEMRTVLPALTKLDVEGVDRYVEDLIARIDTPQLKVINIRYANWPDDSQIVQLVKFMDRSLGLNPALFRRAQVSLDGRHFSFISADSSYDPFSITIACEVSDWHLPDLTRVFRLFFAISSHTASLDLYWYDRRWEEDEPDDAEWLQLLHLFPALRWLCAQKESSMFVARTLENTAGEMVHEFLPFLELLCLQDQPESSVEKFLAIRRDSGRPVTVVSEFYVYMGRVDSSLIE